MTRSGRFSFAAWFSVAARRASLVVMVMIP